MKLTIFFSLVVLCIANTSAVQAQDLFDNAHSLQYAKYLMRSGNYEQAGWEYQRLVYLHPQNDTFKIQLLKSYRLGQAYDAVEKQWQYWRQDTQLRPEIHEEYAKSLLFAGRAQEVIVLAATPGMLPEPTASQMTFYSHILLQQWPEAKEQWRNWPLNTPLPGKATIGELFQRAEATRYKKPWVAAGLSAVIPGAGKAYTKDWADGAIALVFVGLNSWQTYRRFSNEGVRSFWGWFHGGFAAGFYIGNIYGAHKAARLYNGRQKHKLQHEAERIIYPVIR